MIILLQQQKNLLADVSLEPLGVGRHIFTQGRYGGADVPFGGLIDFRLGGSIFGTKKLCLWPKNCVFGTFAIYIS